MASVTEPAFPDKPGKRPEVWRICRAEAAIGDKPFLPAAVWHVLRVDGRGDEAVGRVAAAQRGVVHRRQLLEAGLSRDAIAHRVRNGRLYSVLSDVYVVGQPGLQPLALELAALLHAGRDAVLSHRSAATLWGLASGVEEVQITVCVRNVTRPPCVRIHRVGRLDLRDVRLRDGVPVTAPARTLIDFAAQAPPAELARALAQARVLGLVTDPDVKAAIARCPGRAGVGTLHALLKADLGPALTRSEAERRLLALIARAQLPRPECNVRLRGFEVDFLWRAQKLVVEVDGHAFHGHRAAFERDRTRDQTLTAAGYRVMRVTWRQLEHEPIAVVARIAQALASAVD